MDNKESRSEQPLVFGSSTDLIVYQLKEIKALMKTAGEDFRSYTKDTDRRLNELEQFKAAQIESDKMQPKIDAQKIILTLIASVSSIVALALGYYNFHR